MKRQAKINQGMFTYYVSTLGGIENLTVADVEIQQGRGCEDFNRTSAKIPNLRFYFSFLGCFEIFRFSGDFFGGIFFRFLELWRFLGFSRFFSNTGHVKSAITLPVMSNKNRHRRRVTTYTRGHSKITSLLKSLFLTPLPPLSHFVIFCLDPPPPHVTHQKVTNSDLENQ